ATVGPTAPVPAGELVVAAVITGGQPGSATAGSSQMVPYLIDVQNGSASSDLEDILCSAGGPQEGSLTLGSATNWYMILATLRRGGFAAEGAAGDVTERAEVTRALERADALGSLVAVAHCAGVSPTLASAAEIFRINFGGTLTLLDEAARRLPSGSAIVVIASMAGHMARAAHL